MEKAEKYVKIGIDGYTYNLFKSEKDKWRKKTGRVLDNSDILLILVQRSRALECLENDKSKTVEECKKETALQNY
ncbi:hypothetical protein AFV1_ORF74 [Captovirus AFV1]|uniref:Uncharacterized protein ORF74 n=1 Tax=Acidianus filamentous virus 1 (isolate United States/Yellowstone) TaxID=654909 RepID=Y074_AFV1Y|nr:hypothetical protein AFV1_ORF74 [Captovirus AFV1]Q70LD5.1 RecName: Full=Uncharacterized protein ORF74 [Acidianus filamentous virus 1 (isolate Yellowstone)]CAD98945.1 hypothetical protein [Captovirus AFV1]